VYIFCFLLSLLFFIGLQVVSGIAMLVSFPVVSKQFNSSTTTPCKAEKTKREPPPFETALLFPTLPKIF